jgi:LacI family transcriptional regulator
MGKINQQYIADQLGLSITTVSRCFTNHPRINPETRAKVYQLAAELGYSYNAFRNQKPSQRAGKGTIAVLVGVTEQAADAAGVAGKIFAGITQKAAALDYRVELFFLDPSGFEPNMRSRRIIPNSSGNHWTGVVLVFPFKETAVRALMTKFQVISVLDEYEDLDIDSINPDQVRGIARMVKHLFLLGHRQIGFLSWRYKNNLDTPWVHSRLGSYFEHHVRFGLPFDPDKVMFVDEADAWNSCAAADVVIARMKLGMTALVCAADHQAYELIRRLKERGVRVPEDISITGYDGIPVPQGMHQLTTYSTPFTEIGVTGMVALQRRIDHPLASRSHVLVDGATVVGVTTRRHP